MTYSAAMMTARRGEEISGYDVVVADEFHHCGAEEWGKGVTHILDANESAKVVGFSATPIRYSDGGRNMADEMFDGNVAYSMELEEAWLRGILPIPKYVTAFYEAPKELGRLAKSIDGIKDEMVMKRFQKKYENLRRSLTEAGGVREAIAKHLKKRDAKVIVFCPRVAKLREFMLLRREWFGAVNSEIHAYKTVSADPYGSEDFQAFKDDKSDALKVLYCVNQLNEAVHVKGVDAIVMVRPTKSPTVYRRSCIGSVTYWTIEVERRTEYKENEWLPCDESGRIDDGYGNEPDAIVAYFSSLEGSREERAFELAKNEYLAWLEHRTDRYTTVYGYLD